MAKNIYDDLHAKYMAYRKSKASAAVIGNAVRWFVAEVTKRFGSTRIPMRTAQIGGLPVAADSIEQGKMYLFEYRASPDEPYYDRFPLVIPFSVEDDRMLGFNVHYLPIQYRVMALAEIVKNAVSNAKYPPLPSAFSTFGYTNTTGGFRFMRVCVRTYLFKQIRSRVAEIPATGWLSAAFLPIAGFRGQNMTETKVLQEMLAQIRTL